MTGSCAALRLVTPPPAWWRGLDLDALTDGELATRTDLLIALDDRAHIVALSAGAARWAGVAAWQARGRSLLGELAWLFGAAASAHLAGLLATGAGGATTADGKRGPATLTLVRGATRSYLAIAPHA